MGCDGIHPKVLLDLTKKQEKNVEFLEQMQQSGKRPQQACTTMFFLIPKNVRCEALRAPEVAKWQQKFRVDWAATDGRNGGAQRTVWEVLMEMESKNRGSRGCGLGAGRCLAWATHLCFPRKILPVFCGYFEHQRRVQFEGCAAEPLTTLTAILPGSKWSRLLLRIFLQDALGEVTNMRQCSKDGVTLADSVETLGVDLITRVKRLGAKEKAGRKKCKVR